MSYGLIYYKNFSRDGHNVRLEIHSREMEGDAGAKEIGNFTELTIHMNESHAAIDEAIHKSTLTFSMVDAPDMPDTSTTKNSGWEFFYNSEPDEYSVSVYEDGALLWHGYVRQDAWEGDLVYRNTLTISCIDGLGRLNDVFYEPRFLAGQINNGMAKVKDIINAGMEAAKVSMYHYVTSLPHELVDGGQSMLNWAVDTSAFEGKTWGEIVEPLLNSLGLCIRYDGRGSIVLRTLRDLHTIQSAGVQTPQFLNRSGHYSLLPGYKAVKESTSFEAPENKVDTFTNGDFNSQGRLVKDKWNGPDIRQYTYGNNFNDEQGGTDRYVLVQNIPDDVTISGFNERTIPLANRTKASISFNLAHNYDGTQGYKSLVPSGQMVCRIKWVSGSLTYFWDFMDNTWVLSDRYSYFNLEGDSMDLSFDVTTPDSKGQLVFGFVLTYPSFGGTQYGDVYTRLGGFTIEVDEASFPKAINVTTNFNEANTLNLDRKSDYAQAPSWMLSAGSIGNSFYKYLPAEAFPPIQQTAWNDKSTFLPFQVQVHMQLLALHAKPNYLLSGDLKALGGSVIRMDGLWGIYGRSFMLTAGNYNCLDGFLHDATLEEFDTWEDIFGSISASYDYKEGEYPASSLTGATSVTSSGGGGGEGGGITLAELQAYLESNHYINSLSQSDITNALGYTPANGTNAGDWDDAASKRHTHSNKSVLDGITGVQTSQWNDAANKKHTHSNKSILDTITQALINAWNSAVEMAHRHNNKALLDTFSQSDVDGWDDAAEKAHTHSNKSVLDGITAAKVQKWDSNTPAPVYICYFNSTPYNDVDSNYRDHTVFCDYNGTAMPLTGIDSDDNFIFKGFEGDKLLELTLSSSGWSSREVSIDVDSGIYKAIYGTTRHHDVGDAVVAGKIVLCSGLLGLNMAYAGNKQSATDDVYEFVGFYLGKKVTASVNRLDNWSYVLESETDVFNATYNVTHQREVESAVSAGNIVICSGLLGITMTYAGHDQSAGSAADDAIEFVGFYLGKKVTARVDRVDNWSYEMDSSESQFFICEFAETTYAEAIAALNAGKILLAHDGGTDAKLLADLTIRGGRDVFVFSGLNASGQALNLLLWQDNSWATERGAGANSFLAYFDDTTYSEVLSQINAGHDVVVRDDWGNGQYIVFHLAESDPANDIIYFFRIDREGRRELCTVNADNIWTSWLVNS